jgi:lysophospholipase L1-like esterase
MISKGKPLFVFALLWLGAGTGRLACAQTMMPRNWVGSWAAAQQIPEPQNALPAEDLRGATLRQVVHLSVGGTAIRVHLSNAFGTDPLHFISVHVARASSPGAAKIDLLTDRALMFAGKADVTVPAGAEYISDPLEFAAAPLSNLAISFYLDTAPAQQTGHPGSRSTSYFEKGDVVSTTDMQDAGTVDHWYMIGGVDVASTPNSSALVAFGDSITDGHGATTNGNDRWTDALAQRLQASPATRDVGVLNMGIGGNHLLSDGLGPNALARFDRDVLAQTGVRSVIVFEGVNDLGELTRLGDVSAAEHAALVSHILAAYEQMIVRAHATGIKVIGATILPYTGSDYYHPGAASEVDRQAINAWIRKAENFDAVVDFDAVTRDPAQPERLLPAYDCGDHLHPSPAGYRAMAEAIPVTLFTR